MAHVCILSFWEEVTKACVEVRAQPVWVSSFTIEALRTRLRALALVTSAFTNWAVSRQAGKFLTEHVQALLCNLCVFFFYDSLSLIKVAYMSMGVALFTGIDDYLSASINFQ